MKQTNRFLFHVFLWMAVWLMAWLLFSEDIRFLRNNLPSFVMQILVIAVLIYVTAPRLLFKKRYLVFGVVSFLLVVACSFLISEVPFSPENGMPPPQRRMPGVGPPLAPPKILIQFLVLSIAYVLATFVETFLFAQKKEEETIRNRNENLQMELKFLKSQINPHFLFNALNNIYALSVIDSNRTQESIGTLSDMLRYVLYECEQPVVPIKKEIAYIRNYLDLFQLKSSKPFTIKTDFQVADLSVGIAPMLFIPFVENALKHGNIDHVADGYLEIKVHSDTEGIDFFVGNSVSERPVQKDAVGGIGLENVKKRLEILYPKNHRLNIEKTPKSYTVNLSIRLNGTH
ncbi:sensor histidine kinase [Pseudozobellia thermophila]|uniref:Histidine kinase n=1 Tax=Pseudozobellia thermophila TaxID=192903 RepID=A0A1M6LZE5_9FLAO|nr:histidine kinase [Pseudozobellia thermophila]SHJ76586.1 Histidine kinase [Pseudozobellia thermophila]